MITSKQRAYLRGLANSLETIFQIGKGGITEELASQVLNALNARELIKLHVLETCEYTAREAADGLSEVLGADVVSVVGNRFVLFRPSDNEKKRKIDLSLL
ncbi:MAG: YhbY family RNA-binding protein [Ruminococcus sp.]|nr:YhbY family RNA-binding protein [Candidatus Apopatosoma intestinale]